MTKEEHALPPLPEATPAGYIAKTEYFYTAKQMREYALAAIMRKEPQGWMPIETAPKTSKAILVYCAERKNTFTVTWARDEEYPWSGKWKHFVGDFLNDAPTHWMPLPPPPTGKESLQVQEPISDAEIERIIDSMPAYSGRYEVACVRAVLEKAR